MEGKSINRYRSFCKSLNNLKDAKGKNSDDKFILIGARNMTLKAQFYKTMP